MIELYEFQQQDVDKLSKVPNRLIATEMGCGKTYQAGAMIDTSERTLWVGPLGTLRGSRDKMLDMGLTCPMTIIDPKNRNKSWNKYVSGVSGIYFIHWEALRLCPELSERPWHQVIADECHRAQNRKTQQTKALKSIKTGIKTAMSGTPITGHADKYWSILNWFDKKQFRSYWKFFDEYVEYELVFNGATAYKQPKGPKNVEKLLSIIDPFYVRHLKKGHCCADHPNGVMSYLPDKYYTTYPCDLYPQQRRAYESMRADMLAWVGANEDTPLAAPIAIAQHTRLNQFSVAFAEIDTFGKVHLTEPSSKLDACMQILEDNPGESVVIWSQFKQMIKLLEARCKREGISIVTYTGDNPGVRDSNVRRFAQGGVQVFAGTTSAGGVGVDGLQTACSTMIFIDRQFPVTMNQQAEDRLWRDGQSNAVQVIDLVAVDTHDAGRHATLATTWADIKKILGDRG